MKALILAGGKGTRMGYKMTPKCMAKVGKKPILEHLINKLNKAGIDQIVVNVSQNHNKIFKYFGTRVLYLYEPVLLGEMGTEQLLKKWLGESYIVMNGDTLSSVDLRQMIKMGDEQEMSVYFFKERYGGTKYEKNTKDYLLWDGDGAKYFDCGTPSKLAKARRMYK